MNECRINEVRLYVFSSRLTSFSLFLSHDEIRLCAQNTPIILDSIVNTLGVPNLFI